LKYRFQLYGSIDSYFSAPQPMKVLQKSSLSASPTFIMIFECLSWRWKLRSPILWN